MREWTVFCEYCGAEPGTPCMDVDGNDIKTVHRQRRYLYRKTVRMGINPILNNRKVYGLHFIVSVESTTRLIELYHQMLQEIEEDEFCRYWLTENESITEELEMEEK